MRSLGEHHLAPAKVCPRLKRATPPPSARWPSGKRYVRSVPIAIRSVESPGRKTSQSSLHARIRSTNASLIHLRMSSRPMRRSR
jgi:hypothetical protein